MGSRQGVSLDNQWLRARICLNHDRPEQEQAQLAALRHAKPKVNEGASHDAPVRRDIEGGFGGQEDLEDRYALCDP